MDDRSNRARILVVDDEAIICRAWMHMLPQADFEVHTQPHAEGAVEWLARNPVDVVIADVNMNIMSGLDLLRHIKGTTPAVQVIIMTGKGTFDDAVAATRAGAFNYITKPFYDLEACTNLVRSAARVKQLEDEVSALRRQVDGGIAGILSSRSPAMRPVIHRAERVAQSLASVLLTGQTGCGKTALARAIHQRSGRKGRFVDVNCGALPTHLVESQLFGHVRGAFTSADFDHDGYFREADGGTIFLDEVGNLPHQAQVKLLSVLNDREVRPVGGRASIQVDVRVISATNAQLEQAVADGSFREDLYYRLKVVELRLPNLSERVEDVPRLALQFLQEFAKRSDKRVRAIAPDCMERLQNYDWPGNIRQLKNVIEAAVAVIDDSPELMVEHLSDEIIGRPTRTIPVHTVGAIVDLDEPWNVAVTSAENAVRAAYIQGVLDRFDGNLTRAAAHAGKDRPNFRKLRNRYLPEYQNRDD